jgi:uncharacterized membrane protein (UPF0127 family)
MKLSALTNILGGLGTAGAGLGGLAYANMEYKPPSDVKIHGNWEGLIPEETPKLTNWQMWKTKRKINNILKRLESGDPDDVDILVGTGLHRVKSLKDDINLRALKYLNFTPSIVAVPERGQDMLTTFRQYGTNLHLHSHPKNLFFHKDKWPSLLMAWEQSKDKPREERVEAIRDSIKHITHEGIPGFAEYFRNMAEDAPTYEELVKNSADATAWINFNPREGNSMVPMKFEKQAGGYSPIIAELVETDSNAILGLSNIDYIPENYGMLFKEASGFWMPDVKFDLDVIFMDKSGHIQEVQRMVKVDGGIPPVYRPEKTAACALETRPGWCERNNVQVGDRLAVNGD